MSKARETFDRLVADLAKLEALAEVAAERGDVEVFHDIRRRIGPLLSLLESAGRCIVIAEGAPLAAKARAVYESEAP